MTMTVSDNDRTVIRDPAKRVAEIAALPEQTEKGRLWRVCNEPERITRWAELASRIVREIS